MKILHTVEFYAPSVGGAQEVVRQISENLVVRGHQVAVATTRLTERTSLLVNGVTIHEFDISGNSVRGIRGESERYKRFLIEGDFDVMMNYAAQEWTMDLAFPVLQRLPYRKVMVPCGFSALYDRAYRRYFAEMPRVMRSYDHLIFHSEDYRDIGIARQHGMSHYSVIPNGASEADFSQPDRTFRKRYGIPEDVSMLLTVGSHTGKKGHRLCMDSLRHLESPTAVLVIIANTFGVEGEGKTLPELLFEAVRRREVRRVAGLLRRAAPGRFRRGCVSECERRAGAINRSDPSRKRVILLNPPREDVVAAYHAADLFVFASNIEYSPLVLFEAMASSTPFVTLDCGNAAEIAAWSGGGVVAPTRRLKRGEVGGNASEFAREVDKLLTNEERRAELGASGHDAWLRRFTWEKLAQAYERVYLRLAQGARA